MTPKRMGPQEGFDIDARPNSRCVRCCFYLCLCFGWLDRPTLGMVDRYIYARVVYFRKARKAAAAAVTGDGAGWGEDGRPSKLQQRRDKRAAKAVEEKMRRLKTRTFSKAGLLNRGAGGAREGEDELQCEHFLACSGCFFQAGYVRGSGGGVNGVRLRAVQHRRSVPFTRPQFFQRRHHLYIHPHQHTPPIKLKG